VLEVRFITFGALVALRTYYGGTHFRHAPAIIYLYYLSSKNNDSVQECNLSVLVFFHAGLSHVKNNDGTIEVSVFKACLKNVIA
jgi:hypothetical protein